MENHENAFQFTYSAQEQAEVSRIRSKYQPQQPDKLARLRALDRGVTRKANGWAITLGTLGALILGAGMSLFMTDLGTLLGMGQGMAVVAGILCGIAGMVLAALAYPVHGRVLQHERARVAPEILRLTDELLQ